MSLLLLSSGLPRIPLIRPGWISPLLSFARAQLAGVESTYYDGTQWRTAAANMPRFVPGLKIEGQRTNAIRNSRLSFSSAPSFPQSTLPTYWSQSTNSGLTVSVVGNGAEGGIDYVDIRFSGTTTAGKQNNLFWEATGAVSASASQVWMQSAFLRLAGGALTNVSTINMYCLDNGGGSSVPLLTMPTSAALSTQRQSKTFTTAASGVTAFTLLGLVFTFAAGAIDFTIRLGWPQLEQASFAGAPILPPALSPAASTRGASLVSAPLASVFPSRRGVLLWSGAWGQNAPSGVDQTALQIDDGSANNRFRVRNAGGGATVVAGRVTSGSAVDATTLGSMTAGSQTSLGLAFDLDAGVYKALLRGGSVQSGSGGPTSASTVRLGTDSAGASAMFGDTSEWNAIPGIYPSDALLAQLVNSMPLAA